MSVAALYKAFISPFSIIKTSQHQNNACKYRDKVVDVNLSLWKLAHRLGYGRVDKPVETKDSMVSYICEIFHTSDDLNIQSTLSCVSPQCEWRVTSDIDVELSFSFLNCSIWKTNLSDDSTIGTNQREQFGSLVYTEMFLIATIIIACRPYQILIVLVLW